MTKKRNKIFLALASGACFLWLLLGSLKFISTNYALMSLHKPISVLPVISQLQALALGILLLLFSNSSKSHFLWIGVLFIAPPLVYEGLDFLFYPQNFESATVFDFIGIFSFILLGVAFILQSVLKKRQLWLSIVSFISVGLGVVSDFWPYNAVSEAFSAGTSELSLILHYSTLQTGESFLFLAGDVAMLLLPFVIDSVVLFTVLFMFTLDREDPNAALHLQNEPEKEVVTW
ncbi:MAG: hypothetical protein LBI11_06930 [Streptococcaceae bacterium]|jgi:hypothetical protein|nr:hypothetical protein [Streptococcaceae bacterium]